VLDASDAAIQRTDTLINKLKWMKAGLLNDLLTRGLDRAGKLRDSVRHPEQFEDKKPFGLIPKGWEVQRLKTYAAVTVGYVGPIEDHYCDADAGVLFLRTGNITEQGIDFQDELYVRI
jgi:type I restriction enzyme S subunit